MTRTVLSIFLLLFTCAACFGQSAYQGLTPGKSTRADVERVLGQPVKQVSETLVEFRPQPLTNKIFVQYREGSPVVERIEMLCQTEDSTCDDLIKSLNLRLPERTDSDAFDRERWKSLYGSPLFIVASGANDDVTAKTTPASRVAFYSRELYEAELERVKQANEAALGKSGNAAVGGLLNGKAVENPDPAYPPIAKAGRISGMVMVQVTVSEEGRVVEAEAVDGHPLLRQAARDAAKQARFAPMLISGRPVKVTGTLVYNFKPK